MPWRDRSGAFSPLKALVLAALFLPALSLAADAWRGALGPKPWTQANHDSGLWAIRLLTVSLAVTPLRQVLRRPRVAELRRMAGVAVAAYAVLHLLLYAGDEAFAWAKVVSEIASRTYLTIGFAALVGLLAMAATSTDAALRRMGGVAWRRLHRVVFAVGVLALLHFAMQEKVDVTEPVLMAGLFLWLAGYRLVAPRGGAPGVAVLLGLAAGAAAAAAGIEAGWYAAATGVDARRVLAANLDVGFGLRPALWVGIAGLGAVVLRLAPRPGRRRALPAGAD